MSEETWFQVHMIKKMDKILKETELDEGDGNVLGALATDAESMLSIL